MAVSISSLQAALQQVLTPIHLRYFPFPLLDLYGAMRLSSVVNWMASGVFDPPSPSSNRAEKGKKDKALGVNKERATALQEVFGILVVVFGGETFLGTSNCDRISRICMADSGYYARGQLYVPTPRLHGLSTRQLRCSSDLHVSTLIFCDISPHNITRRYSDPYSYSSYASS